MRTGTPPRSVSRLGPADHSREPSRLRKSKIGRVVGLPAGIPECAMRVARAPWRMKTRNAECRIMRQRRCNWVGFWLQQRLELPASCSPPRFSTFEIRHSSCFKFGKGHFRKSCRKESRRHGGRRLGLRDQATPGCIGAMPAGNADGSDIPAGDRRATGFPRW